MDLSYPIGKFEWPETVSRESRNVYIEELAAAPERFYAAVQGLNDQQLDTPYRPGGWTVRQVVHHFADSHLNAYVRFRLAMTESEPVVKPYDEKKWAELPDARTAPPDISLQLIESLHYRWVALLRSFADADFARTFRHPELPRIVRLDTYLSQYAWHTRHHVAHITSLRERMGWK